jgi:nanoRNase/pAp phosphatase (c-di-AMP/oligoRNAs hydrolase)
VFLEAMRGKRLLHLGHKDADCDALGSAFALSCLLPGDVGFARGVKASAHDLAQWLGLTVLIDPDPSEYDYVIIYDTLNRSVLGLPLPARYALFDHHEPGGHRYADFHNELADGAEWAWVWPAESTCSLLIDLFRSCEIEIDQRMAVALAAGIMTDTVWLHHADAGALRRLAAVLDVAKLYVEDVLAVIDGPDRKAARRPAVLQAIRGAQEKTAGDWSILSAETDTQDNGFVVVAALKQLGGEICIAGFSKGDGAMVLADCSSTIVQQTGIDLGGLMADVAQKVGAEEMWGTRLFGRIVASTSPETLAEACVDVVAAFLDSSRVDGLNHVIE